MDKLLYIDCCIRRQASRTKRAADLLIDLLRKKKCFEIDTLVLMDESLHHLQGDYLAARDTLIEQDKLTHRRFDYAHEFGAADIIVVAAPFWDLGFPALLKIYIENVSVDGITFYADVNGCHGMSNGKHLIFVTTRGGFYEQSPLEMGSRYMEALSVFFGIDKYTCLWADGLDSEGIDPEKQLQRLFTDIERVANSL